MFRYAAATARARARPCAIAFGRAHPAKWVKALTAITDLIWFRGWLRFIEDYEGDPAVMHTLKLTPHLAQRPSELRQMEWVEINFEKAIWTPPPEKMKMRQPHAVSLSQKV